MLGTPYRNDIHGSLERFMALRRSLAGALL
jgi:hypothetical protein